MKNFIVYIIFSTISLVCSAQVKEGNYELLKGQIEHEKRNGITHCIGKDESDYFIIRHEKGENYIERLNHKLEVEQSVLIPEQHRGMAQIYFDFCRMIDGELFVFSNVINLSKKRLDLVVQKVDKRSLVPYAKMETIAVTELPPIDFYNQGKGLQHYFSGKLSPDNNKILITSLDTTESGFIKKHNNVNSVFNVFGHGMNLEWSKVMDFPYKQLSYKTFEIKVDNNGNAIWTFIEYIQGKAGVKAIQEGKSASIVHYYYYSDKGKSEKELSFILKSKFIVSYKTVLLPNGKLLVSGFYSDCQDGCSEVYMRGSFYQQIDLQSEEIIIEKTYPFNYESFNQYLSKEELDSYNRRVKLLKIDEMNTMNLNEIILMQDGSISLIAESSGFSSAGSTEANTPGAYFVQYKDILVVRFNKDGELLWETKIPKRQEMTMNDSNQGSYILITRADSIILIYNDHPKNFNRKPGIEIEKWYGTEYETITIMGILNKNGEFKQTILLPEGEDNCYVNPAKKLIIDNQEILLVNTNKNDYQFSRLIFH